MRPYGIRRDPEYRRYGETVLGRGDIASLSRERIRLPSGRDVEFDRVSMPDAVAIVAVTTNERGERCVVLVEQFRHSVEGYMHEIPAGLAEPGEDFEAAARRELAEETGFHGGRFEAIASLLMIPGTSSCRIHFFLAEGVDPGEYSPDDTECLRVRRVPFDPLVARLVGEPPGSTVVVDAKTHLALLHAAWRFAATEKDGLR